MLSRRRPANRRSDQRTPWQRLQRLNWRRAALVVSVLALLAAVALTAGGLMNEPVTNIAVVGRIQRVSASDVEMLARQQLRGYGLLRVPVASLRRAIRRLPWVDDVAVERLWPRGLRLHVVEQVVVARWNGGQLVNQRGELFGGGADPVPGTLPLLNGPEGRIDEVFARYVQTEASLLLAGVQLHSLTLDARGAWELALDNGIIVRLGRSDVDARFQRLVTAAWPAIAARSAEVAYLDMRYTNGFAVSWRRPPARLAHRASTGAVNPDV
jgi:cell division protein FtsQ